MTRVQDLVTGRDVVQDDYPELEGVIIEWTDSVGTETGVIKGCNRSVGLTVLNLNDPEEKLFCYRGPVTPGYTKENLEEDMHIFDLMIEGIRAGAINWTEMQEEFGFKNGHGFFPGACAYGM